MTKSTIGHLKVSLEIHLPQLVRLLHLKPLASTMFITLFGLDLVMAMQDRSDRTGRGCWLDSFLSELPSNLASAPSWMGTSHPEHRFFNEETAFLRAMFGTTTAIIQSHFSLFLITLDPFITSSCCDPILTTQRPDVRCSFQCFLNKFLSLRHSGILFPWHTVLLLDNMPILQNVYTMSPNRCLLCPQSKQDDFDFMRIWGRCPEAGGGHKSVPRRMKAAT